MANRYLISIDLDTKIVHVLQQLDASNANESEEIRYEAKLVNAYDVDTPPVIRQVFIHIDQMIANEY